MTATGFINCALHHTGMPPYWQGLVKRRWPLMDLPSTRKGRLWLSKGPHRLGKWTGSGMIMAIRASNDSIDSLNAPWLSLAKLATFSFVAGAVVGPACDGFHSSHNVLHYHQPLFLKVPLVNYSLETCWWVPLLFGLAGIVLGVAHPLLDDWTKQEPQGGASPPWSFVLAAVLLFVLQYYGSGALEEPLLYRQLLGIVPTLDLLLCFSAFAHFFIFDRTRQGLFMALLTAFFGPLLEVYLINGLDLYHYEHASFAGVPTWIPWVYFCGSPAVGCLGRRFWADLKQSGGQARQK